MNAREISSFEDFRASLKRVQSLSPLVETEEHAKIRAAADRISRLESISEEAIADTLSGPRGVSSEVLRVLGLTAGLSHERLTSELRAHLQPEERRDPWAIVQFLETEFGLVTELRAARQRQYQWSDVLVARAGSRGSAGRAIAGGRLVEDAIEAVVKDLRLPYQVRTRFNGRNASAPCDIAIPAGGTGAEIVCAAKGFDSTGSKLTDAVREIEEMASVRKPSQYVLAVVDGIGWHRRQSDLRRIYELRQRDQIDGLYSLALLEEFRADVDRAARLRHVPRG